MIKDKRLAWDRYQDSLAYMTSLGITDKAPKWVDLYEGRQWPPAGELTKNMPRPVINIIKMISRNKKAGVLSNPIALHFTTDDTTKETEQFDRFYEYISREMELEEKDADQIEDAIKKGTMASHFYWDKTKAGKRGNIDGGLESETIDPFNVHVANPNEKDIQKQRWVIISSREEVENIIAGIENSNLTEEKKKIYIDNVAADESDSIYREIESDKVQYVTVLTEYYRDDTGEVFWQKHTKNGEISDAVSMTPTLLSPEGKDTGEDSLPDTAQDKTAKRNAFGWYPVVVGQWDDRDKSYLGIGEVESLEHNQKAINLGMALQLLKVQNEAFGKWLVKEDALQGQTINNDIMQVLIDHSKLGNGVQKIPESPISGTPMNIIEGLMEQTRMVTGATEVMTGEVIGAGMSGAAIATLQAQALKPIEEKQKMFWRYKQRQGMIMAEFFKHYYEGRPFTFTKKDSKGKEKLEAAVFNGSDYVNTDFRVIVQAGAAAAFSESGDIAMLESLVQKGLISAKTMIDAYPDSALSNKKQIKEAFDRAEQEQVAQLTTTIETLQAQMAKAAEIIKAQSETVEKATTLVQENQRLKNEIIALGAEFANKIQEANKQITETTADAAKFAQIIAAQSGIKLPTSPITQPINKG